MKKLISLALFAVFLYGCSTTRNPEIYDAGQFTTANYQKNIDNTADTADLLTDLDKNQIPAAKLTSDELSGLVQADLYYNQGSYSKAYQLYQALLTKYQDPRIVYKAIICLEHISNTTTQNKDLNNLVATFIKIAPHSKVAKLFQIRLALNQQNTSLATSSLKYLIKHNPDDARAILLFVSTIVSDDITTSDYTSVHKFAAYVLDHYSNYPEAHLVAILSYAISNDSKNLITQANYIKLHYPNWDIPLYWSSDILMHYAHYDTAISLLQPLVVSSPVDPVLQNVYVAALISTDRNQVAESYLNGQLDNEDDADNANVLLNLGIVAANNVDYSSALNYFLQAKQEFRNKNEEIHGESTSTAPVLTQYNTSTAIGSENPTAMENMQQILNLVIGALYDYQGQTEDAIKAYLDVNNKSLRTVANIMLLDDYSSKHNYAAVNKILGSIAKREQMNAKQQVLFKAGYYLSTDNYQLSYNILRKQFANYHNDVDYLYQYAATLAMLKHTTKAIYWYKKYIKLAPNKAYGYNDLAYIYATQTHKYKLAKNYADIAYKLDPTDPNVLDTVGWVYYKLGQYTQAVSYIKTSYEVNYDPEVAKHLIAVYLSMNRPDLAKQVVVIKRKQVILQLRHQLLIKSLELLSYAQFGFVINGMPNIKHPTDNNKIPTIE